MALASISIPPPPTRYGPSMPAQVPGSPQTIQSKPSQPPRILPPPTRFGPTVQAKSAQLFVDRQTIPPPMTAPAPVVVQPARPKWHNSKPDKAIGSVTRFQMGGVRYLSDSRNQQWYWHGSGERWVKKNKVSVPSHNRFVAVASGRGAPRPGSFLSQEGSGASYYPTRRARVVKASAITEAKYPSAGKRRYRANMAIAAAADGVVTGSATTYAASKGGPVIAGGYNWCHLIGHGGGGSDAATNIVAASTHANSEQLQIEKIFYRYRKKGVAARVTAELENGSAHLARALVFDVFYNQDLIYQRRIDGYRTDKPSYIEMSAVEVKLSRAIYTAAGE